MVGLVAPSACLSERLAFGPVISCPGFSTVSTVMYLLSSRLIVIVVASELCECASGQAVVASEISAVPGA